MNLRRAEKDDVSLVVEWWSNSEYMGDFQDVMAISRAQMKKVMLEDTIFFMIERRDGAKIGHISGWRHGRICVEIGFALVPSERGKGYGTEAIQMMVDHLFLKREIVRIQAPTATGNIASQKALEKAGFSKEGVMRKSLYAKGEYKDQYLYSILREEWKTPKILTRTTS